MEKGLDREAPKERSERRSTRDSDGDSSRTRRDCEYEHPSSPLDLELPRERNERRLMKDAVSDSSRTRHKRDHEHSSSPADHCQRSKYNSLSPRRASNASTHSEEKYNELKLIHSRSVEDVVLSESSVNSNALWLEASDGIKKERILGMGSLGRMYTPSPSSFTAATSRIHERQLSDELEHLKEQLAQKDKEIERCSNNLSRCNGSSSST